MMLLSTRLGTACLLFGLACADTSALGFPFNNDGAGPDGPWNCLNVSTDAPAQYVDMYPSMLETSMLVNITACQAQSAKCPQHDGDLWAGSAAFNLYADRNSASWAPSELEDQNGGYVTEALGLEGRLRYVSQRITLLPKSGEQSLDGLPVSVADNVAVNYPNGSFYTAAVGYYSLYGGQKEFTYSLPNGTKWTASNQMWMGYTKSVYPSVSYGLHMGSSMHNVSGKLFLGGYDASRCIDTPIAATSNSTFYLSAITLGVSAGASAFLNHTSSSTEITSLLQTNTSSTSLPLSAQPDPGLPYLYLPSATCAALAAHLPVTYSPALNLYLWNTSSPAYTRIVSSPHYLAFTFANSSTTPTPSGTIVLPLALLNLTLSTPLADPPTPYFPCAPFDASASLSASSTAAGVQPQALLGRAFLQGAFLAQNWHAGTTWLAQAAGPGAADESVKTIGAGDGSSLATGGDGSAWNETWSGVLSALERSRGAAGGAGSGGGSGESGLSTGAKAGVGVGVAVGAIAVLVLAGWLWRKRKQGGAEEGRPAVAEIDSRPRPVQELENDGERREIDGNHVLKPEEIDGRNVVEIDGTNVIKPEETGGRNGVKPEAFGGNTRAELP